MKFKLKALVFLVDDATQKVCLATKAYGIKKGFYNGYGGKVAPGETIEEAAARELLISPSTKHY